MRRRLLGATCLVLASAAPALAQDVDQPEGYGGFGGQYVQAPSLYYPYPGIIESRFGTYFNVPVIPGTVETDVEAASIHTTNAAYDGVHPVEKAKADADAVADEVGANKTKAAAEPRRKNAKPSRAYARGYDRTPAPFNRELPRGNLADFNNLPAGVPTYTPYARYQTYGQSYAMGPYGSNFYSGWWKGYTPMDVFNGGAAVAP